MWELLLAENYDIAKYTDPGLGDRPQTWYTFDSAQKALPLKRHTSEEEVYVTVEEFLGEGQMKSGANGIPFAYTEYDDTQLRDVTFYLHDHLGNMRVTYTTGCIPAHPPTPGQRTIALEHAADYYPYGSILREMVHTTEEKYLSTHHQRDQETGLDYRGARYYDSDVARFLSLDPLAADYASWSPYNYVMGNPESLVDPTGRSAECGCPPPCGIVVANLEYMWNSATTSIRELNQEIWQSLGDLQELLDSGTGDKGYMLTSNKRDVLTNNADRKGDPSGYINVDYLLDYNDASKKGPKTFSPELPEPGPETFTKGFNKAWKVGEMIYAETEDQVDSIRIHGYESKGGVTEEKVFEGVPNDTLNGMWKNNPMTKFDKPHDLR